MCRWIEKYLVHSQGDWLGQPFRLTQDQKRFIYRAYELYPSARRVVRRAKRGRPKGSGKTELAGAIACVELAGPARCKGFKENGTPIPTSVTSPDIPVAAASFEQADTLFAAARVMFGGPLADFVDIYDTEILLREAPGRMYRVAAATGTNDGKRPTFFVGDETHEWIGSKKRVWLVLENGLAKRRDAWSLEITTAGVRDEESQAEDSYELGRRAAAGEVKDPGLLFDWLEASDEWDLNDPEQLEAAVREANPEPFTPVESIIARYGEIAEHEFRRYHLNQWVNSIEQWDVAGKWDELADTERKVSAGAEVALGLDGSYNGDSTALIGCTVDEPHLFTLGIWEKPEKAKDDWRVPISEVEEAVRQGCRDYTVRVVHADPFRWQRSIDALQDEGVPIVDFATNSAPRMVPATTELTEAVLGETPRVTHDGDPRLARHVKNAVLKIDKSGPRIVKEHKMSKRRIDAAVAAVIAHDGAIRHAETKPPEPRIRILGRDEDD